MPGNRKPGMLRWGLLAALCFGLSKGFEGLGDLAPYAAEGVSGDRLGWHLLALVLLIAAIAFGFLFMRGAYRRLVAAPANDDTEEPRPAGYAHVFEDEADFDPDAALSRYMARRKQDETSGAARPSGFGRRGVRGAPEPSP